jgi:hypothetical protein
VGETPSQQIAVRPRTKQLARITGLGVVLVPIVGALLWVWLSKSDASGPLINGKPATFWTRQLTPFPKDPEVITSLANERSLAIPTLVQQLSLPDVAVNDFAKKLWRRLPAALQARVPEPITRAELRAGAAFALARLYERGFIGPTAATLSEAKIIFPELAKALHDRDLTVRVFATRALGKLDVISAKAIDACAVALKDPIWMIRSAAVDSLGRLASSDERAIRLLTAALSDSHPQVRKEAADLLELRGIQFQRDDALSVTNRSERQ